MRDRRWKRARVAAWNLAGEADSLVLQVSAFADKCSETQRLGLARLRGHSAYCHQLLQIINKAINDLEDGLDDEDDARDRQETGEDE